MSKFIYHDDVRNHGSGAAGMTNMLRTFGKRAAAMTAAGDVLKGVPGGLHRPVAVYFPVRGRPFSAYLGVYLAAILAVVGHLKPLYFGFKGGKGVLVAGGAILAVQPALIPFLLVIFLACLIPHRYGVPGQHRHGGELSLFDAGLWPADRPARPWTWR